MKASLPTSGLTPNPSPKGEGNIEGERSRKKNSFGKTEAYCDRRMRK